MKELFIRHRPSKLDLQVWASIEGLWNGTGHSWEGLMSPTQAFYRSGLQGRVLYDQWTASVRKGQMAGQVDWGLCPDGDHDDGYGIPANRSVEELWVRSAKLIPWFARFAQDHGLPLVSSSNYFTVGACYAVVNRWQCWLGDGMTRRVVFIYDGANPQMGTRILARVQRLVTLMLRTRLARAAFNAGCDRPLWTAEKGLLLPGDNTRKRGEARECLRQAGELVRSNVSFVHVCPDVSWVRRMSPEELGKAIHEAL